MKQKLFLFLLSAVCLPVAAQTAADDSLRLDSLVRTLPEVMVSGERPVVKVITHTMPSRPCPVW